MKLYDWRRAPNPRRVRIFLAEKGIDVPIEQVGEGFRLTAGYVQNYPHALVPMLELDDGTQIGEAMAICRYFEELYPEPPLMGTDARDKAIVEMWERRANDEGMLAAQEVRRNSHPAFADRGLPGSSEAIPQISDLVERGKARLRRFFAKFDTQIADNEFLAGTRFTVADATTLCAIDFAKMCGIDIPDGCRHLRRWYEAVSSRPSARA